LPAGLVLEIDIGERLAVVIALDEVSLGFFGRPMAAVDHPPPTGRVVYEMEVVVTRQERHFEPPVRRVLGADKEPKGESANRESPSCHIVAAPMADEPSQDEGNQPDATNPRKVMLHRRICDFARGASGPESTDLFTKEMSPVPGPDCRGLISAQTKRETMPWSGA
jgi:hypothetical protein